MSSSCGDKQGATSHFLLRVLHTSLKKTGRFINCRCACALSRVPGFCLCECDSCQDSGFFLSESSLPLSHMRVRVSVSGAFTASGVAHSSECADRENSCSPHLQTTHTHTHTYNHRPARPLLSASSRARRRELKLGVRCVQQHREEKAEGNVQSLL